MLHELLFTLSGYTGKLFFKNDNGEVKVNMPNEPFYRPHSRNNIVEPVHTPLCFDFCLNMSPALMFEKHFITEHL